MQITIEKNVPRQGYGGDTKPAMYPFKAMEIGDSFVALIANSRSTDIVQFGNTLHACAKSAIGSRKISMRRLPDSSGYRVWRVA